MAADGKGLYIPPQVLTDWQLSPNLKLPYAAMLQAADEYGLCRLSAREIAERCGMSLTAASANRRRLVEAGYLDKCIDTGSSFWCLKHLECTGGKDNA